MSSVRTPVTREHKDVGFDVVSHTCLSSYWYFKRDLKNVFECRVKMMIKMVNHFDRCKEDATGKVVQSADCQGIRVSGGTGGRHQERKPHQDDGPDVQVLHADPARLWPQGAAGHQQ